MDQTTLVDEYGKRTNFMGKLLASESSEEPQKPHWAEVSIWMTAKCQYVVERKTRYRIRHLDESCGRIMPNQITRTATEGDTYPCPRCNRRGIIEPGQGYGIQDRIAVDVARDAGALIDLMANTDGTHSGFAKEMLAAVSEQDNSVHKLWMEVTVE
jgi:hypothetical protein